jgi:hypothetical protein
MLTVAAFGLSRRVGVLLLTSTVVVVGAVTIFVVHFAASGARHIVIAPPPALAPPPNVEHPLAGGKQIPLAGASSALGASVVLPNTSTVSPADAGTTWTASLHEAATGDSSATVAVTFPRQGIIIDYTRPVPYADPQANYAGFADGHPDLAQAIDLNGVPALAIAQNSNSFGSNVGSVEFVTNGTKIVVMGHYNRAALTGIAASILSLSS